MTERLTEIINDRNAVRDGICGTIGNSGRYFIGKAIDKLAEYENAEEEGRLIILPCKPGITLYVLRKKYTKCSRYNEEFDESSCCGCEDECDSHLFYYVAPCPDVTAEQILEFKRLGVLNKIVFFSKEEAEKALKEKSNEGKN